MNSFRYSVVLVLLAVTAFLLHIHRNEEIIPSSEPLTQFPYHIDGWVGQDVPLDQQTLSVLGPGDFLSRSYSRPEATMPIGLFIAYFPTQRTGVTIHSPQHCLPGAGWFFESSKYVNLTDSTGKVHQVGEYVISNHDVKQFVIYWYYAHGRSVASEYKAKFYLVADAIRMNRTDGSLIRVMEPIDPMKGAAVTEARVVAFTKHLMPILPRFIPN